MHATITPCHGSHAIHSVYTFLTQPQALFLKRPNTYHLNQKLPRAPAPLRHLTKNSRARPPLRITHPTRNSRTCLHPRLCVSRQEIRAHACTFASPYQKRGRLHPHFHVSQPETRTSSCASPDQTRPLTLTLFRLSIRLMDAGEIDLDGERHESVAKQT